MRPAHIILTGRAALVAIAILSIGGTGLRAQDELTLSDKARILDRLEELSDTTRKAKFGRFSQAMSAYQAAAATPAKAYEFYLDCYKLIHFDQQGKKFSEFRDWKAKNAQRLRATDYSTMLQFQLQYLVMTIRALNMEDRAKIIPQLQSYIDAVVSKQDFMGQHARSLRTSVAGTVFAQAYGIDTALTDGDSWELAPLNLVGHYEKAILPALREEDDASGLASAWDRLIKLETAIMANQEDVKQKDDFIQKRLPAMSWAKWSDIAEHGGRAKAATAMLALLEKNLAHENAEDWIADLVNVVNGVSLSVDEDEEKK